MRDFTKKYFHLTGSAVYNSSAKKGGGVGILINNKIKYRVCNDLYVDSELFENCMVELQTVQRHLLVSAVYRPPNTNQKEFIESFKTLKDLVYQSKLEWIIGLDHNMDLLKIDQNKNTSVFMTMLLEHELYPVITRLTRITKSTTTLIDNIIVSHTLYNSNK